MSDALSEEFRTAVEARHGALYGALLREVGRLVFTSVFQDAAGDPESPFGTGTDTSERDGLGDAMMSFFMYAESLSVEIERNGQFEYATAHITDRDTATGVLTRRLFFFRLDGNIMVDTQAPIHDSDGALVNWKTVTEAADMAVPEREALLAEFQAIPVIQ